MSTEICKHRGDVDYTAAALLKHISACLLTHVKCRGQIDREYIFPLIYREILGDSSELDTGAVDEDINASEYFHCFFTRLVNSFFSMQILNNGVCPDRVNGLGRLFHFFQLINEDDLRSAFVKASCRSIADTAGSTCYNGSFPFKGKSLFCVHG